MKKLEIKNVKGTNDYGNEEQIIRNYISDTLRKTFEKYGYKPLSTSLLCYYDLLSLKYDEENDILKEIYKVTDQADRSLARLDIDITIKYNNRKIMSGIIEVCNIPKDKIADTITIIDKFEKLSKEEIRNEFLKIGIEEEQMYI